jgi:hypothetical protein
MIRQMKWRRWIWALFTLLVPLGSHAGDIERLRGFWQCQEEGVRSTLEFASASQLLFNGQPAAYQLLPNMLQVEEEYGLTDYYYQLQEEGLVILSPDGSVTYCQKGQKPAEQARRPQQKPAQAPGGSSGWPPPYRRPGGRSSWEDSDPGSLLYKFAGRWDAATSNTLHNIYLKPDGTFEEAYEAGYSGTFSDEGGYQTGNWGASGAEQGAGHWSIQGSLRQGQITLIDRNGNRTTYNYKVHCRGSECDGSEYFFNGKLYTVNYIYR